MKDVHENVEQMIRQAKGYLAGLIVSASACGVDVPIEWGQSFWEVKALFGGRDKDQTVANRFLFTLWDDHTRIPDKRQPLPDWFVDFAKGVIISLVKEDGMGFKRAQDLLAGLRRLHQVLEAADMRDVTCIRASHFKLAHKQKYDYVTGNVLARLARFIDEKRLTAVRLRFKNPLRNPRNTRDNRPDDEMLTLLALALNDADADDSERIILECIRLHLAIHDRIGSTVFIPLKTADGSGPLVKKPREGKPGEFDYGIKYYPEKGFEDGVDIKPLDRISGQMAETAINALIALCAPARARARLLEKLAGEGRAPIPKPGAGDGELRQYYAPDERIPVEEVAAVLGISGGSKTPAQLKYKLRIQHGLLPVEEILAQCLAANVWSKSAYLYRASDVEAVLLREAPDLVPLRDRQLRPILTLSNCLLVRFDRQFEFGRPERTLRLIPRLISPHEIGKQLGMNKGVSSIFDRRGLKGPQGERIYLYTHGFRKLKNTFLDEAGLTQIQQALIMGRTDVGQNRHYNFPDVDETLKSHLERLEHATHEERLALFRQGVRDGLYKGFVADTYRARLLNDPVEAEAFLEEFTMHVLVTRYGACTNNWWAATCPRHNQCFDDCRHYHVTGDAREVEALEEELAVQTGHREIVQQEAEEGEFRADTALDYYDRKIAHIEQALHLSRQAAENRKRLAASEKQFGKVAIAPVPVFPEGKSNYVAVKDAGRDANANVSST